MPNHFNVFSENIFKEALENVSHGTSVNGVVMTSLLTVSDDNELVADTDALHYQSST